jgi:hypothetical protein
MEVRMSSSTNRFCPYCLTALVGLVVLMSIPGLAGTVTPFGKTGVLLLGVPMISALLRRLMLGATRRA